MKKLIQKSKKFKIDNYRVECFKTDKNGDIACVEIGVYLTNTTKSSLSSLQRHLNGLCGRKKVELSEYELDRLMFYIELPDALERKGWGYAILGCQFKLDGLSAELDELVYDVLADALIDVIESSKLDVKDK